LEGEAEALTRKAIDMALNGDVVALRLCLERAAQTPALPLSFSSRRPASTGRLYRASGLVRSLGAIDAFSRRPLSRAYCPFILKGSKGSIAVIG
jgi:hypothetical protein